MKVLNLSMCSALLFMFSGASAASRQEPQTTSTHKTVAVEQPSEATITSGQQPVSQSTNEDSYARSKRGPGGAIIKQPHAPKVSKTTAQQQQVRIAILKKMQTAGKKPMIVSEATHAILASYKVMLNAKRAALIDELTKIINDYCESRSVPMLEDNPKKKYYNLPFEPSTRIAIRDDSLDQETVFVTRTKKYVLPSLFHVFSDTWCEFLSNREINNIMQYLKTEIDKKIKVVRSDLEGVEIVKIRQAIENFDATKRTDEPKEDWDLIEKKIKGLQDDFFVQINRALQPYDFNFTNKTQDKFAKKISAEEFFLNTYSLILEKNLNQANQFTFTLKENVKGQINYIVANIDVTQNPSDDKIYNLAKNRLTPTITWSESQQLKSEFEASDNKILAQKVDAFLQAKWGKVKYSPTILATETSPFSSARASFARRGGSESDISNDHLFNEVMTHHAFSQGENNIILRNLKTVACAVISKNEGRKNVSYELKIRLFGVGRLTEGCFKINEKKGEFLPIDILFDVIASVPFTLKANISNINDVLTSFSKFMSLEKWYQFNESCVFGDPEIFHHNTLMIAKGDFVISKCSQENILYQQLMQTLNGEDRLQP